MTILLVDLSAVYCRHWYRQPEKERDLDAAYKATLADIRSWVHEYEHTVICCDTPGPTWRHKVFPEYKANREHDAVKYEGLRKTEEALAADGLPVFSCPGYEGDDVIATCWSLILQSPGDHSIIIATEDKDLCQLVSKNCSAKSTLTLYTPESVEARFGVKPIQIDDYLALVGDKSDNIPGVKGVGAKRAAALLQEHSNIAGIVKAVGNGVVSGAFAVNIAVADKQGTLEAMRDLIRLKHDAPITLEQVMEKREPVAIEAPDETWEDTPESVEPEPESEDEYEADGDFDSFNPNVVTADDRQRERESKAMVVAEKPAGLQPKNLAEAKQLAKYVIDSRLFSQYGNPQAVLLTLIAGSELGLGAMASLKGFHIVEGRPSPSAQLIMGLCKRSSQCKAFYLVAAECNTEQAVCITQHAKDPKEQRWTYTINDADIAGLTNRGPWKKHPASMLKNRVVAEAGRFTWPELVGNLYDPSEF